MLRVSVTQLDTWQQCQKKWQYRYKDKIQTGEGSEAMQSGIVFHNAVELGLARIEHLEPRNAAQVYALDTLGGDNRLFPGVMRAIDAPIMMN